MPEFVEFTTRETVSTQDGTGNYEMAPGTPIAVNLDTVTSVEPVGTTAPPGVTPKGPGSRLTFVGGAHRDVTMLYADMLKTWESGKAPAATGPLLVQKTPDATFAAGAAIDIPVAPGAFTDPEGPMTYSTGPLPVWLSFDAGTGVLSGTAPMAADVVPVEVIATGAAGKTANETFTITITAPVTP
jgi:hypothetical protein